MTEAAVGVPGATLALSWGAGESHRGRRYKGEFSVSICSKLGEALTTQGLCSICRDEAGEQLSKHLSSSVKWTVHRAVPGPVQGGQ